MVLESTAAEPAWKVIPAPAMCANLRRSSGVQSNRNQNDGASRDVLPERLEAQQDDGIDDV